jgi:hypothetical protein
MGGAVLAEIHLDYEIPGGIQLVQLLFRFSYENFRIFFQELCGD